MTKEQTFLIDVVSAGLIKLLISQRSMSFQEAVDTLYNSHLYELLSNPATGLYIQSPCYNFELLQQEL